MNQDERASQLSAMFDGELPSAECELLSRRLARDEQLRATWSRYAVIGAALRAEPVASVKTDFSRRVSAALVNGAARSPRSRLWRGAALGTAVAAGVAGAAIMLLRNSIPVQGVGQGETLSAYTPTAVRVGVPTPVMSASSAMLASSAGKRRALISDRSELASYVVPPLSNDNSLAVSASLADYVVAHSEVSSTLVRGSLLSALVGNESVQPAPPPVSENDQRQ